MNLTDFRDAALLKLEVDGPFAGDLIDRRNEEYILVQIIQMDDPGSRRRRPTQVAVVV